VTFLYSVISMHYSKKEKKIPHCHNNSKIKYHNRRNTAHFTDLVWALQQNIIYVVTMVTLSSKSSGWKCFVRFRLCRLSMIDIQVTTKNEHYDHIALLYLETRKCRYQSISFVCFYLYVAIVIFIDYSDMDKMMDINNEKC
jgi:hypothetical protein